MTENRFLAGGSADPSEKIYCGTCRGNCGGGCFLNIHVRDGKVVRTSPRDYPDKAYNRICAKGLTLPCRIYSPERIRYPLRRVGERGEGKWERITWEEAIREITDKWKAYRSKYGPHSLATNFGSGNYAVANGAAVGSARFLFRHILEACNLHYCVDFAIAPGLEPVLGDLGTVFGGNEPKDLLNAKTIFCWGANPVNSQKQTMHFLLEARDKGAKLVTIDPTFTVTAAKSDLFVPIRPGTDAVLAYAMMNVILEEDLVDWAFVKVHTDAGLLIKESDQTFLRLSDIRPLATGEADVPVMRTPDGGYAPHTAVSDPVLHGTFDVNGISVTTVFDVTLAALARYTPDKAEEICNIPASQIRELAGLYAKNTPSTIYTFFGIDHYYNGHYGYRALAMLAALTGNLGKPGAFCGAQEVLGTNFINISAMFPSNGNRAGPVIPITLLNEVLDSGKLGGQKVPLKSVYCSQSNIISNSGNHRYILEAFRKIEFLVVSDVCMGETAKYADILLPAAHWFEVEDLHGSFGTAPYITLQEKAIDPPGECKADYEIYRLLAEAMGFPGLMPEDPADYLRAWLNTDAARELGLTLDALREKKAIRCLPGENYIHAPGGKFATASGRAHFFNEAPTPAVPYLDGFVPEHERGVYWEPPYEAWHENELYKQYPFNLLETHMRNRTHTQWHEVELLNELDAEPAVHINPADAQRKHIAERDRVKVFNDRGYVVMAANLDNGVRPGTVTIPHGWEAHQFIEGHYQDLTMNKMHPMAMNTGFFDVLVNIEKVEGNA